MFTPVASLSSMLKPFSIKYSVVGRCPFIALQANADWWKSFRSDALLSHPTKYFTVSNWPCKAAR